MTITTSLPGLVLRSPDASWNRARWEQLPDDGNRYEVIDGVLYMTTAPSYFHQRACLNTGSSGRQHAMFSYVAGPTRRSAIMSRLN